MLIKVLYMTSVLLFLAGIIVYAVFRNKTVDEARSMLSGFFGILLSRPVRFFGYRSGHGRHSPEYIARHPLAT